MESQKSDHTRVSIPFVKPQNGYISGPAQDVCALQVTKLNGANNTGRNIRMVLRNHYIATKDLVQAVSVHRRHEQGRPRVSVRPKIKPLVLLFMTYAAEFT